MSARSRGTDTPLEVHRAARSDLVRDVERRRAEVAVRDRAVERSEPVVGARDARREREQVFGVRVRVAHVELEALTEAFLHLRGERERTVVASILVAQHITA